MSNLSLIEYVDQKYGFNGYNLPELKYYLQSFEQTNNKKIDFTIFLNLYSRFIDINSKTHPTIFNSPSWAICQQFLNKLPTNQIKIIERCDGTWGCKIKPNAEIIYFSLREVLNDISKQKF